MTERCSFNQTFFFFRDNRLAFYNANQVWIKLINSERIFPFHVILVRRIFFNISNSNESNLTKWYTHSHIRGISQLKLFSKWFVLLFLIWKWLSLCKITIVKPSLLKPFKYSRNLYFHHYFLTEFGGKPKLIIDEKWMGCF